MKIKHKKTLFIASLSVLLFGIKVNQQIKSEKILEVKELREQNVDFLENSYLEALNHSYFNEQEREMLKDYFLPHLLEYQDKFEDEFIANVLFSTENTYVNRNKDFNNSYLKASYSSLVGKIPYGELFVEGIISLDPNYSLEEFYHEYCHTIQSWNQQKNIYGETYANFYSDGNYDDLYGFFTMLGILGDSKQLFYSLANGKIDDYWNFLQDKYPNVASDIKALRENVELTFKLTYQ